MSDKNTGGPAFPIPDTWSKESLSFIPAVAHEGMTMRDYFAAKAMQALIGVANVGQVKAPAVAAFSYQMADAMLKARES